MNEDERPPVIDKAGEGLRSLVAEVVSGYDVRGTADSYSVPAADDLIDQLVAALASPPALDAWAVATALHETAVRNHNLGEGPQRAICDSIEAHADRAERMVARLTPASDTEPAPKETKP